ncbi:hypothetical protein EON65_31265 [archaeon]|nr:MAG: hypothetical protein EON65_31265 [archaeon]
MTYGKYSWRLSSDDLAAPVCYALTGRLLWMMVASTTIARLYEGLEFCTSGQLIISYLIISLATYLFTTIIDINIARKSFQGTIVELNLRRGTGLLVFIRITLSILQIIILVPGIVGLGLLTQGIPCGQDAESTKVNLGILVILLFTQLVHSIVALSCCQLCLQTSPANAEKRAQQENREKIENRLRKIVRVVGRGGGGGASERSGSGDAGVRQVAEVMDRFFHSEGGDLDIVFSDILAGMVLLRHLQHHRRVLAFRELQSHPPPLSSLPYVTYPNIHPADPSFRDQIIVTALLPRGRLRVIETNFLPSHPINASLLRSVARYSIYCCFPYSDTYVFHGQVGNALCRQADGIQFYRGCYFGSRVRTFEREGEGGLKGLNFCSKDLTRLSSKRFALEETELIFMSDANDLDHKPYAVFVDHYHQEVVLTLRGTMTLEDAVTDALCLPISVSYPFHYPFTQPVKSMFPSIIFTHFYFGNNLYLRLFSSWRKPVGCGASMVAIAMPTTAC